MKKELIALLITSPLIIYSIYTIIMDIVYDIKDPDNLNDFDTW